MFPDRGQVSAALDRVAFESGAALSNALVGACAIVALVDVIGRPGSAPALGAATAACGAVLLFIRRLFRGGRIAHRSSHALIAAMAISIIGLVLFRASYEPGPIQIAGIGVVMIATGFFLFSTRWLVGVLAISAIGWLLVIRTSDYHAADVGAVLMLLAGAVTGLAAHVGRLRTVTREESLRLEAESGRATIEHHAAALSESEARMRMILDTALDGVLMMDAAGRVSDWNPQAEVVFGWSKDEAIGRRVVDFLVPSSERSRFELGVQRFLDDGGDLDFDRRMEFEALHRDGHVFPVELTVSALRLEHAVHFSAFVRDISLRRSMEEALREELRISQAMAKVSYELSVATGAENLLDKLCNLITDVLDCEFSYSMLLSDDGEWVTVHGADNRPGEWESVSLLRFPGEPLSTSMKDRTVLTLSPSACDIPLGWLMDRYDISAVLLIGLRRGDDVIGIQTAGYRSAGAEFSSLQVRAAKELAKIASIALENARLVEELRRANQLKSEFVATMSHELRTPLNVILGYEELLLDGAFEPLKPDQGEIVERIGRSARELHDLITATLDLSRLEAGRAELNLEDVDLLDLTKEIEGEMRSLQIDKPQVRLRWRLPTEAPEVLTDRAKLKVVIKNLVNNGLKFTDQGEVVIEVKEEADGVSVAVSDTGIGIPKEALASIFEPFLQIDATSTRRHGGVGLGLHIVQRLIGMLGGTIRVESEVEEGTSFVIELPYTHPSLQQDPEWDVGDEDATDIDPLKVA